MMKDRSEQRERERKRAIKGERDGEAVRLE